MNNPLLNDNSFLTDHFFRNEYGKMIAVITRYLGPDQIETAEDIVQETLLKAVEYWPHHGVPENPTAWLYTTAKNLTFNKLKREKHHQEYELKIKNEFKDSDEIDFSKQIIDDEQLRMILQCCQPSISEDSQIALVLKILCGFSISEIANAFFTSKETINKRLVRGRKKLKERGFLLSTGLNSDQIKVALKTLYLLFNEGYSPTQKNELIRFDLCLEAIRLAELLAGHSLVKEKIDIYSLLALMYLNTSRFKARYNESGEIVEMAAQDRKMWNQKLINKGIHYLNLAIKGNQVSTYLILASISANHCIAPNFEETDWEEILSLYNSLLTIEDSPIIRLNRVIVLAKVRGNSEAISALKSLEKQSNIGTNHLFHSALGEFYQTENDIKLAIFHYKKALSLSNNERNFNLIQKKIKALVPIS